MNAKEAAALCRLAKAACPQQAIDEHTPEAWFLLLGSLRFEDARNAVIDVTRSQPFVAPSEIIAQVKRVRGKRIADFGPIDPPRGISDADYRDWYITTRTRVGDGDLTRAEFDAKQELGTREMPSLENVFRHVDEDSDLGQLASDDKR